MGHMSMVANAYIYIYIEEARIIFWVMLEIQTFL